MTHLLHGVVSNQYKTMKNHLDNMPYFGFAAIERKAMGDDPLDDMSVSMPIHADIKITNQTKGDRAVKVSHTRFCRGTQSDITH